MTEGALYWSLREPKVGLRKTELGLTDKETGNRAEGPTYGDLSPCVLITTTGDREPQGQTSKPSAA